MKKQAQTQQTMELMTVTPAMATEWLKNNGKNFRRFRKAYSETLARDITANEWELNGESLKFNCDGSLRDGQHRLNAIIIANKSIQTWVMRGLTNDSILDQPLRRTAADSLARMDVINVTTAASVARMLAAYEVTGRIQDRNHKPTLKEVIDFWNRNKKELVYSVALAAHNRCSPITGAVLGSLHYLFHKIDKAAADGFVQSLASGENLKAGDPVLQLRRRCQEVMRSRKRIQHGDQLALCIKAWNMWRNNDSGRLVWRPVGRGAESFPDIE